MNAFMCLLPAHDARGDAVIGVDEAYLQRAVYSHPSRGWGNAPGDASATAPERTPAAARAARFPTLCHALASRMDPMMRMYDRQRRDDLAEVVRGRLLAFLTHPPHVGVLGNRESNTVARFFERLTNGYKMSIATPKDILALEKFLTFWLSAPVRVRVQGAGDAADDADVEPGITFTWLKGCWEVV